MNLFLITSAINTPHGVFSADERLQQTLKTIESIKEKTDAEIMILDGSKDTITEQQILALEDYATIMSFSHHQDFQNIQKSPNHDVVKNALEMLMLGAFWSGNRQTIQEKYDRVFKISGRYTLSAMFDESEHMKHKGKIVIGKRRFSQFPAEITGNVNKQYMSRLYSVDASLAEYMTQTFSSMIQHFFDRLSNKGYLDTEHLLYHHLDSKKVVELPIIGVEGQLAPNGRKVED